MSKTMVRINWVFMLLAWAILGGPAGEALAVVNGGFESGVSGWWGGGLKTGGAVAENPAAGGNCLKITRDFACQDKIAVVGGKNYKISMQIRSDAAPAGAVYVQLSYRGPGVKGGWYGPANAEVGGRTEKALFVTGGTQAWKEFSTVVTVPAGADQMLIYLRKVTGSAGAAYYDDVKVEPTDEGPVAAAPAAASAAAPGAKGNLAVNGGFENASGGWWGPGMKTGGIVPESPAEGANCLKIVENFACQDRIAVAAGKNYKISMQIRSDAAPEGVGYVQLSYRGAGVKGGWYGPANAEVGGRTEKALFVTGGTQAWKEFSTVVTVPAGADQMLIYLRKVTGSAGAAYYDDVKIEATEEAAAAAAEVPEVKGNLIANGGFENGSAYWWGAGIKTGGAVAEKPAEGASCLKITGDFACQDKRPVKGGRRYRVSMKVRSGDAPDGSVYVQLSFRGEGVSSGWYGPASALVGGRTEKALFTTGGTQDWKEFSTVVEAPPGADQALIYLRKIAGSAGAAYFDDVKIEATEEAATTALELKRRELATALLSPPSNGAAAALEKIVAAAGKAAGGKLVLARDGAAQCHVHVGSDADARVLAAARDLAAMIQKISGTDLGKLSHDGNPLEGPLVIVGRDNELAKKLCADGDWKELGEDGFIIRAVGPNLLIAGNTPGGTMYGVNWFLDRKLGVKWLSPDFTHVPSSGTIEVAAMDEKQIPRFKFRQILSVEGQDKPFAARNLLNGNSHGAQSILPPPEIDHWDNSWQRPGLTGSFYHLLPPKEFQSAHPGWYAGGQVAMMNPEVRQALADAVIKRLKGVPNYQDYWFGLMDNDWGWDMDPASAAFAKEHGGVASAPHTDLASDVLQRVRKILPGAKIAVNAYHWGFSPPTGLTIPEGLLIFPMTIHLDYSTSLFTGQNVKLGKDIEGWNALSRNTLLWDHVTNFNGFIQPTPNIHPICETIRWLAPLTNIQGYFAEGSWNTPGAEFAALRAWIMGRMLWNPATDYKAAIAEYCDAYYGPAGKFVNQYIDLMHEESARTKAPIWEKTNVDSAMLNLDFVTKADALFAQAEAAVAGDPVMLKHVRQARVCVDYVILVRRKEFADQAVREKKTFDSDFANRLARFTDTIKAEGIKQYRQAKCGTMEELADIMAIERKAAPPPELAANLPKSDWVEIQDLGFNRYTNDVTIVPDAVASDGATVRMGGDVGAPYIQLKHHKLPLEGRWEIFAEVRVDADGAGPGDVALGIGTMPPQNNCTNIAVGQLKKDGYTLVKAPGGPFRYSQDDGDISYIRGGGSKNIKEIYVDRFIFVRAGESAVGAVAE
ncbi:MAG: DUF4838 domain-containing protein [Lentisphaeria bacterium]|jgi:hypothetical protein